MEISATDYDGAVVLSLTGTLDATTATDAAETVTAAIQEAAAQKRHPGNAVLDLSGVSFMSSAGLRTILAATQEARALGGDLRLAAATSNVHRVLDFSGFIKIINYYETVDDAIASFQE